MLMDPEGLRTVLQIRQIFGFISLKHPLHISSWTIQLTMLIIQTMSQNLKTLTKCEYICVLYQEIVKRDFTGQIYKKSTFSLYTKILSPFFL